MPELVIQNRVRFVVRLSAIQGGRLVVITKPIDFTGEEAVLLQRVEILIDGMLLVSLPMTEDSYEDDEDEQSEEEDDSIPLHENRVPE